MMRKIKRNCKNGEKKALKLNMNKLVYEFRTYSHKMIKGEILE